MKYAPIRQVSMRVMSRVMRKSIPVLIISLSLLVLFTGSAASISLDEETKSFGEMRETQVPIITFTAISADSTGISLILNPYKVNSNTYQPAIIDIEFKLIKDNNTIFTKKQNQISLFEPTELYQPWQITLENNMQYIAQADIYMYVDGTAQLVKTSTSIFTAKMDADIIDVYGDGNGASATINAISMVPLDGEVTFTLLKYGKVHEIQTVNPPQMTLNSDDETVNILWDKDLQPETYEIQVELSNKDGSVIDRFDDVFQSEKVPTLSDILDESSPPQQQAPGFSTTLTVISILAVLLIMTICKKNAKRM